MIIILVHLCTELDYLDLLGTGKNIFWTYKKVDLLFPLFELLTGSVVKYNGIMKEKKKKSQH